MFTDRGRHSSYLTFFLTRLLELVLICFLLYALGHAAHRHRSWSPVLLSLWPFYFGGLLALATSRTERTANRSEPSSLPPARAFPRRDDSARSE